jgi:hypothetical protein
MQIFIKFGAGETFVPRVQIWLCDPDSRHIFAESVYHLATL